MTPLIERFWKKIKKEESCWIWTAAKLPRGYGFIGKGGRGNGYIYAHRLSYILHKGDIPKGMFILHSCDNPSCVNPDHLFLGTQMDNMKDMRTKDRGTQGDSHPNAIITKQIASSIREEYKKGGTSLSILGRKYGICFQHVHDIIKNKIWR